ncbi:hypothetical protein Vadar_025562 [Vaccinium darrowii]|uniref:Uncharacterized protein n=1 Tax=Vaccinium darrowii TaxID=229202 RepID=A0ACB7X3Y3_9ERIC|nr:hypothetical protein Vadar_025562 [Vaccinium darrowii]
MSDLYEEAKKLKDRFLSFEISHVLRDFNSEADAEANFTACLAGKMFTLCIYQSCFLVQFNECSNVNKISLSPRWSNRGD